MKVFVLGHRGMLGHVVARYFSEHGMQVLCSERRYEGAPGDPLVEEVRDSGAEWIINATGKFSAHEADTRELRLINSQFPAHLKCALRLEQRLIHASSDGVFAGTSGNYAVGAARDATDEYGFSKILGEVVAEQNKAIVIRTSIIGPGGTKGAGLMNWFLKQSGTVNGFSNHHWSGVTTLEWARVCHELITGKLHSATGFVQPTCREPVSKFEILEMIAELWNHPVEVRAANAPSSVNRTLVPHPARAPLRQQLHELKAWY